MARTSLAETRGGGRLLVYVEACADACVDAQRGFATAASHVTDLNLRSFFEAHAAERAHLAADLHEAIASFGVEYRPSGSLAGRAHRGFISARSMIARSDRAILEECERGEREAKRLSTIARHEAARIGAPDEVRDLLDAHDRAINDTHRIILDRLIGSG
jgi:uncharacterized protein (TIGR02284 family)